MADLRQMRSDAVAFGGTLAMLLLLLAPRGSVGLVVLIAGVAAACGAIAQPRDWFPFVYRSRPAIAGSALALLIAISTFWSADPTDAIGKAGLLAALVAVVAITSGLFRRIAPEEARHLAISLLTGYFAALIFLGIEEFSGQAIKGAIVSALPFLQSDVKHLRVDGDVVSGVALYVSNRSLAAMVLVLAPMAMMARYVFGARQGRLAAIALALAAGLTVAPSQHETSIAAILNGACVWLLTRFNYRAGILLLIAGWLFAVLLVVPNSRAIYDRGVHLNEKLPVSMRARVILWNYTAERVPERFWFGVGASSTKVLDEAGLGKHVTLPGHVYPQRTGPHAHNVYLQIWYELGAVGALVFGALGLALIHQIAGLGRAARPYAAATFATAATVAATSYGAWQPWFMGCFAISALLLAYAIHLAASRTAAPDRSS